RSLTNNVGRQTGDHRRCMGHLNIVTADGTELARVNSSVRWQPALYRAGNDSPQPLPPQPIQPLQQCLPQFARSADKPPANLDGYGELRSRQLSPKSLTEQQWQTTSA